MDFSGRPRLEVVNSKDNSSGETQPLYRVVDEIFRADGNFDFLIQVLGTGKTFKKSVIDLYKKEWLEQFSKEDVAEIAFKYASVIQTKFELLPLYKKSGNKSFKHVNLITVAYCAALILSNLAAAKLSRVFSFDFPSGLIFFPLTYIFDDVLTEVYGFKASRRVIWLGCISNLIVCLGIFVVVALPPSPHWGHQQAFEAVFALSPKIFAASLFSYLFGEFINSYILAKIKILTQGRYLWLRTIGSTACGVSIENVLFCFIVFSGTLPTATIWNIILFQFCFKVGYEILVLPITYWITNFLKRVDNIDHFDYETNFNPFSLRLDD
jgi:uncharacterized integral membrane protein (TIGR00697 family)